MRYLRRLYQAFLPDEVRFWLYKIRHLKEFKTLRYVVYESPKANFSLRQFEAYQCLFIHIPKAAGTSVAQSLFGELPYHYTASELRVIFGRRKFNKFYKFSFVRNPWDRLYSAYSYLKGGGWNDDDRKWFQENLADFSDFNTFVLQWLDEDKLQSHIHFRPQVEFLCDWRGKILVDFLGYFETIQDDFPLVADRLGLDKQLAHVNASKRRNYRDVYSLDSIEKVRSLYRKDINLFGYDFDEIINRKRVEKGRVITV